MPKRILVVEDESIVARDIQRTLQRLGFDAPMVVDRGENVLDASREFQPDLVLMDIQLKGRMNGIEAARALQDELSIPVLFLTAHSDVATVEGAKGATPLGFLIKPFEEDDLRVAVEVALAKATADRQLRESYQLLSDVIATVGDAVLVLARDESILFANARACELMRLDPGSPAQPWPKQLTLATQEAQVDEYERVRLLGPTTIEGLLLRGPRRKSRAPGLAKLDPAIVRVIIFPANMDLLPRKMAIQSEELARRIRELI
ncbi:MAG: response regulator [Candidatus Thermoplasmatota archaeon]